MKILNLYAGIGGNRKLWGDHEVTAVEYNKEVAGCYQQNFPHDNIVIGDAHQYLLDHFREFDFIWASPPCPTHSKMMKATRHDIVKYPDMKLYQEIIFLQHFYKGLWLVENVIPYYDPLIPPAKKIGRHLFWSNFKITGIESPKPPVKFITGDTKEEILALKNWLGLKYDKNIYVNGNHSPGQVLRNCVHPIIGKHILNCALKKNTFNNQQQATLFQ